VGKSFRADGPPVQHAVVVQVLKDAIRYHVPLASRWELRLIEECSRRVDVCGVPCSPSQGEQQAARCDSESTFHFEILQN
jgi:hypothetical protein